MGKKTYLGAVDFVGEIDEQVGILFHIGSWFQGASRTPNQSLLGPWDQLVSIYIIISQTSLWRKIWQKQKKNSISNK